MATSQEVTDALKFIINELSLVFTVDSDGYLALQPPFDTPDDPPKRHMLKIDGGEAPVLVYSESITDRTAQILNPFAEGIGIPPATALLLKTLRSAMTGKFQAVIMDLIVKGANASTDKKKTAITDLPPAVTNILTTRVSDTETIVDLLDLKTRDEYAKIVANPEALLDIVYLPNTRRGEVKSKILTDEKYVEGLGCRKKTITALQAIVRVMLGATGDKMPYDLSHLTAQPIEGAPSRFSAHLVCVFKIYQQCCDIMDAFGQCPNMEQFEAHIRLLPDYTKQALWLVQASKPSTQSHSVQIQQTISSQNATGGLPPPVVTGGVALGGLQPPQNYYQPQPVAPSSGLPPPVYTGGVATPTITYSNSNPYGNNYGSAAMLGSPAPMIAYATNQPLAPGFGGMVGIPPIIR